MAYRCFDVDVHDRVAHLRLSRPAELNTMTADFWRELPEIVTGLSDAGSARCVVISSTGKHFSAGMDLSVFTGGDLAAADAEAGRRNARLRSSAKVLQWTFTALEKARMPVIAAVQGGVIGGAVDLVTACDVRYASADAFFCVQEINLGMTADVGTLQRLGTVVPEGFAREMASPAVATRCPRVRGRAGAAVLPTTPRWSRRAHDGAGDRRSLPLAVWGTKVAMNYARDHSVGDALDQIATWQAGMFQPADMAEAFTARPSGGPRCSRTCCPSRRGCEAATAGGAVRRSRRR
jgi:enoyl-CoA hydratase